MTRRQWLLTALITLSALSLVNARYQERRLYTQMERTERDTQKLASEMESLQLELTALRNPAKIEAAARKDLRMSPIRPQDTLYFVIPSGMPVPGAPAGAGR